MNEFEKLCAQLDLMAGTSLLAYQAMIAAQRRWPFTECNVSRHEGQNRTVSITLKAKTNEQLRELIDIFTK